MLSTVVFMMIVSNGQSFSPMAQELVPRNRGGVRRCGNDQLSPAQVRECGLHGTLGEAGCICERAQTGRHRFPFRTRGLAVKIKIDEIRRRLAIVPDEVAQKDVDDVVVHRDCFTKSGHF
jgi:hypothetical protein